MAQEITAPYPYSKVLERLIHKQLASYFDDHNLLCKSQSGFRRMHSTETAVTYFADEILMNMDKRLVTGSVIIDLAKAFDTVEHDICLENYSITVYAMKAFHGLRTTSREESSSCTLILRHLKSLP